MSREKINTECAQCKDKLLSYACILNHNSCKKNGNNKQTSEHLTRRGNNGPIYEFSNQYPAYQDQKL